MSSSTPATGRGPPSVVRASVDVGGNASSSAGKKKSAFEPHSEPNQEKKQKVKLEKELQTLDHSIKIRAGPKDEPVIMIVDKKTGEVLREVPSEEIRRLSHNIEKLLGLLLDKIG